VKITFVIPYFYPAWQYGGQPRSAFELARALVRRGHSVEVLTTDSIGDARLPGMTGRSVTQNVEGIQVTYYRNLSNTLAYRQRLFWPSGFFAEIRKRLQGRDIVHIHELRSFLTVAAARAAHDLRVPYVISTHGGLRHLGKKTAKILFDRLWGDKIAKRASTVLALSSVEETDARAFGIDPKKIRRLPNPVDITEFEKLPNRQGFRDRWKLGNGKVVLFLGRLHWIKGADLLLQAFQGSHTLFPELRLVMAGPDDGQEAQLQRMATEMSLESAVRFTGHLGPLERIEAFVASDVTVVPSRSEVFALTAVESLMCGTPVLLSSVCGLEPQPGTDEGTVFFKTEDAQDLKEKLLMMIASEQFRDNAAHGRDFVVRHFSADAVAAKAELIYEGVIQVAGKR